MEIKDKFLFSDKDDIRNIKKVLSGKKLSGTAGIIDQYESSLANFFNSIHSIAISSGTAALQAALFAVEAEEGDEVIVPSTCPVMSVFPIIETGAKVVFCDTEKDNFGLNWEEVDNAINEKTKAVIEVPMWGYPTNVDKLHDKLKKVGINLILDLAQAHGTKLNGKYLSSFGDLSCFSTHDRKILATGEGGFILTDIPEYEKKIRSYIQFGNMNSKDFGLNFKLGALQAAVGLNRIQFITEQLEIRKSNADRVKEAMKINSIKELKIIDNGEPNYYVLLLQINRSNAREFIDFLQENGIPSDILKYNCKVLYEYPVLNKIAKKCTNSESLLGSITTIPVHPGLKPEDLDYITSKINEYG